LYDIIIIPIDEWATEYSMPPGDTVYGMTALRPSSVLVDDAGVVANHCYKGIMPTYDFDTVTMTHEWERGGLPLRLNPKIGLTKMFTLAFHENVSGWGDEPYFAEWGIPLIVRIYQHKIYNSLRGST
jgi:hypothetical protein